MTAPLTDAQIAELRRQEPERCDRCGWTLKQTAQEGCVRDNCAERPLPPARKSFARAEYIAMRAERDRAVEELKAAKGEAHAAAVRCVEAGGRIIALESELFAARAENERLTLALKGYNRWARLVLLVAEKNYHDVHETDGGQPLEWRFYPLPEHRLEELRKFKAAGDAALATPGAAGGGKTEDEHP